MLSLSVGLGAKRRLLVGLVAVVAGEFDEDCAFGWGLLRLGGGSGRAFSAARFTGGAALR